MTDLAGDLVNWLRFSLVLDFGLGKLAFIDPKHAYAGRVISLVLTGFRGVWHKIAEPGFFSEND